MTEREVDATRSVGQLPSLGGFFSGAICVLSGLHAILRDRELMRLAVTPLLVTMLLYVAAVGLLVAFGGDLLSLVWLRPEEGAMRWLWYVALPVLILLLSVVLALFFSTIAEVVGGPFYDRMAVRVLSVHAISTREPALLEGAVTDLARSLLFLLTATVFWLFGLVPVIGIPFALLGGFVAWIGLASSAINPALVVTGVGPKDRILYVLRSSAAMAGMGSVVGVSLLVPFLGLLSIPSAVVGASELYARRLSGR